MTGKWLINIFLGLIVLAVLGFGTIWWMGWYTNHGEEVIIPNLKGVNFEEAKSKLKEANLRFEVFDSIYNPDLKKDAVAEQDPISGSKVKPGRIVYLTLNSRGKPMVKMPNLVDKSLMLGTSILNKSGLKLKEVYYKYDEIGHNLILEQQISGHPVREGKLLEKGTEVELIVATNKKSIISDTSSNATIAKSIIDKRLQQRINKANDAKKSTDKKGEEQVGEK